MWQQQLNIDGFQTLYFNAWENDFEPNPLVALIAELKSLTKSDSKEFKSLLAKGAVITKNVLPQLLKGLAARYIDTETLLNAIEDTSKGVTEILSDEIKEYSAKKDGMKEFRESLAKFIETTKGDKPIVFIIDELDRCRPSYAVELLEQVKHFFSVKGIVFVLSIDKAQLGYAIKGAYGNDKINTDEYLRRFIDLEYSIPTPTTEIFVKYLYEYFDFDSFLASKIRRDIPEFDDDAKVFIFISSIFFETSGLTLRQQEKLFAHARIGLQSFRFNQYIFPSLYIFLVYLKNFNLDFYLKIKDKKITVETLSELFYDIIPKKLKDDQIQYLIHLEALLMFMYHNYITPDPYHNSIVKNEFSGQESFAVNSKFDSVSNQANFHGHLRAFAQKYDARILSAGYLINKIDLIEEVVR
jgi:hypothetical protein